MGLKFKLPDQDSEGGKNWTVRLEVKFMVTETVLILEELFLLEMYKKNIHEKRCATPKTVSDCKKRKM